MERSGAEVKKAYIAKMGEPLGEMFYALWHEVSIIHLYWQEYVEMFGTSPERTALLNDVAPSFFRMTQLGQWETSLLHLTRLTDRAVMPVRKEEKTNLTVRALPALIDDANLKATITKLVDAAVEATKFARDGRDRWIAHRDLKLALNQPTSPLAEGGKADVTNALKALAAVLNAVQGHYVKEWTAFDAVAANRGATSLLHVLEIGSQQRAAELKKLEQTIHNKELAAKKSQRRTMILALTTMACEFIAWILTPCIWLFTIYLGYLTSFRALLAAMFLPLLSQLYWILTIWRETGTVLNVFTLLCMAWVVVVMIARVTRMTIEVS